MTTQTLLLEWLEKFQKEHIKARTYNRYQGLIEMHIVPALGDQDISSLSRKEIQNFLINQKKDGNMRSKETLSATSTNMMLSLLNLAFEYACDMEYIKENPCIRIRRARADTKKVEAFSTDEQRAVEAEIAKSGDRRLHGIILCLYTGLRLGELIALTWSDIDFKLGTLKVTKTAYRAQNEYGIWNLCIDTPKTESSERVIPLPKYITDMLSQDRNVAKTPYIVENKKAERMSIRSYQYLFERLTEKAGVRKLNFHALRHTFATRALECGMDIKTLSELMGHKNASITLNRYAHSMMDTKIAAMNKLEKLV